MINVRDHTDFWLKRRCRPGAISIIMQVRPDGGIALGAIAPTAATEPVVRAAIDRFVKRHLIAKETKP